MTWMEPLILHWARRIPLEERQQHCADYREWLQHPLVDSEQIPSDDGEGKENNDGE